jgi:hypothetical protein
LFGAEENLHQISTIHVILKVTVNWIIKLRTVEFVQFIYPAPSVKPQPVLPSNFNHDTFILDLQVPFYSLHRLEPKPVGSLFILSYSFEPFAASLFVAAPEVNADPT